MGAGFIPNNSLPTLEFEIQKKEVQKDDCRSLFSDSILIKIKARGRSYLLSGLKEILSPVEVDVEARGRSYLQPRLKKILSPVDVEARRRSYLQSRLKEILSSIEVDVEARRRSYL